MVNSSVHLNVSSVLSPARASVRSSTEMTRGIPGVSDKYWTFLATRRMERKALVNGERYKSLFSDCVLARNMLSDMPGGWSGKGFQMG